MDYEEQEQPRMTRSQKEFIFILCLVSYLTGMLVDMFGFQIEPASLATINWHYKSGDVVMLPVGTRPEDVAALVMKNRDAPPPVARYGNGVAVD
ncbi:hypothetical protein [Dechloromonas hortensis]|uniref:hypothetical protein n=1 Tax=Dechloromonas hortensis TaxID=337779 RepID=UPI001290A1D2|nr:hypothetical protein [Dechloromonas hortensis]